MTREEKLEEKKVVLIKLHNELVECMKQMTVLGMKGSSKYKKVTFNRAFRMVGLFCKAKIIKMNIDMVAAQPLEPVKGLPMVGNGVTGKEIIQPHLTLIKK